MLQDLPENEEVEQEAIMIKPYDGIQYDKSSPVIRPPGKPTVTMMPLDLKANDYMKFRLRGA